MAPLQALHPPRLAHSQDADAPPVEFLNSAEALAHESTLGRQCGRGALVGVHPTTRRAYVVGLRCKQWRCPFCARRMHSAWFRRIEAGAPTKHIVLTCNPRRWKNPYVALRAMLIEFKRLVSRIRRVYGSFDFVAVTELTRQGWPHFHIAARCPYIAQRWLSQAWLKLTGAPVVHITAHANSAATAREVAKYLLKAEGAVVELIPNGHHVRASRGWDLAHTKGQAPPRDPDIVWRRTSLSPGEVLRMLKAAGCEADAYYPSDDRYDIDASAYREPAGGNMREFWHPVLAWFTEQAANPGLCPYSKEDFARRFDEAMSPRELDIAWARGRPR